MHVEQYDQLFYLHEEFFYLTRCISGNIASNSNKNYEDLEILCKIVKFFFLFQPYVVYDGSDKNG